MNIVHTIGIILVFLIGIEHIGIALLELFASPEKQAETFDMPVKFTQQKEARVSMANQGIYNATLGLMIIIAYFIFKGNIITEVWQLLMGFIVVVGAFGGFTATKKIFLVQMLPALIALICISL